MKDRLYWRFERWASRLPLAEVESLWIGAALRAARNIIRASKIDAVLTTSPPYCVHRIGDRLRRETGLPWIADLRDPIVDNFATDSTSSRDRAERGRVEQFVLRHADQVVVTCDDLDVRLRSKCEASFPPRIDVIHNGFDAVDSPKPANSCSGGGGPASAAATAPAQDSNRERRFVLAHVGSFYRAQSIGPLLAAVRRFRTLRPDAADRFELRIVGSVSAAQKPLIRADDRSNVRVLGYLPHGDAIAAMAGADALFLMTPTHPHGRYCIPAKTFEYLAFGGHIIALVHPASSLIRLLHDAGDATVVNHAAADPDSGCDGALPFDPEPLALAIARRFDAWASGEPAVRRDAASLLCYQRQEQSRRLASLLNTVVKRCRGTTGDATAAPTAKRQTAKRKAKRRMAASMKGTS